MSASLSTEGLKTVRQRLILLAYWAITLALVATVFAFALR
jgi:hypothetical protein